jgi:hypothetical protein
MGKKWIPVFPNAKGFRRYHNLHRLRAKPANPLFHNLSAQPACASRPQPAAEPCPPYAPLGRITRAAKRPLINNKEIMMEYLIDDNYVPLDSSLGNLEYMMEKILLNAQYMENLAEGLDDNDDDYDDDYDDDDYDDDDYDDEDEDDRADLQIIKLQGQIRLLQMEKEMLRQNLETVTSMVEDLRRDAEEARDEVHKLRHDIDWYGETC